MKPARKLTIDRLVLPASLKGQETQFTQALSAAFTRQLTGQPQPAPDPLSRKAVTAAQAITSAARRHGK
ncbi:MAG: hypothetical protein AAF813_09850 [Pseudomonadota bacterium]